MIVREATAGDEPILVELLEAIFDENWDRPWPPPEVTPASFEGKLVLLAEEGGEALGFAFGEIQPHRLAHVNIVYVRPERRRQGISKALLAEFAARGRQGGAEHMSLDVATRNEVGQKVWQRLGFTDWARRLAVPIETLESRMAGDEQGEWYASVHVQSDDFDAVRAGVAKYLPRFGGSGEARVAQPRNGWVAAYHELLDNDRKVRERLAAELSNATGAVVCAIAVEDGAVVRYALFDRGSIVDEYQSVPEYHGPLPPGDVVALNANPTVVARLTGAEPTAVRAVARTAASPAELPPAPELFAQLAEVLGLEGAGRG
ncbi:MAG TPA: GNAT family N-acetyltransferase [Gaiellaceae bacterium]|nr:GNAT family N-acetyltransferase [Gaiellaceae bacterium]